MSIADKLLYLYETKQAIREAIEEKSGIEIEDDATFGSYVDSINALILEDPFNLQQLDFYKKVYDKSFTGDVVIPDFITELPNYMFEENNNITSVTIPDTVTTIGTYLLRGCDNLTSLKLPSHMTVIPEYFLYWSNSLRKIPESTWNNIIEVKAYGFCYSNLNDMSGFTSLEIVGNNSFNNINCTVIDLPNIRIIGKQSFGSCYSLTTVNIGNKIESIYDSTSSYDKPFASCNKLTTINIDKPFGSLEVPANHWGATNSTIYWNDGVQTPPNESVNKVI